MAIALLTDLTAATNVIVFGTIIFWVFMYGSNYSILVLLCNQLECNLEP